MTKKAPLGIELFAGCGGLSTGFLDAGLRVAAGFELDRRAVDAYEYNHSFRGSHGYVSDLSTAGGASLLAQAKVDEIDFLIGGPPCQPFSIVGKRGGTTDDRASLIGHFVRLVVELKPSVFLLENVPNLLRIEHGAILESAIKSLSNLGYGIRSEIVSAADFGVPQIRKRLFVVGVMNASEVRFPERIHGVAMLPYVTSKETLDDLPDAAEFGECGVFNHEPTMHSADMIARLRTLVPGERERGSFHDRLHPDRPSFTLRAGSGNFSPLRPIHYRYDRVVTVRESARIQGFSDAFVWPDRIPRLQQYRQVGNAVPPPLAEAFAKCIAAQMGWSLAPDAMKGDADSRPPAMTMTDEQRVAIRRGRTRGASLGRLAVAAELDGRSN
jgi:DNA (cytosine-5)-methyltransferase 1